MVIIDERIEENVKEMKLKISFHTVTSLPSINKVVIIIIIIIIITITITIIIIILLLKM